MMEKTMSALHGSFMDFSLAVILGTPFLAFELLAYWTGVPWMTIDMISMLHFGVITVIFLMVVAGRILDMAVMNFLEGSNVDSTDGHG